MDEYCEWSIFFLFILDIFMQKNKDTIKTI